VTVGIISNLDYNFNLTPTWYFILSLQNYLLSKSVSIHSRSNNYNDILQLGINNQPVDSSTLG
jgi:hypothetical protein